MIRPIGNKILIKPVEPIKTTEIGVLVKRDAANIFEGEVVGFGPDVKDIEPGATIWWSRLAGHKISFGGADFTMIRYPEVLAYENPTV